MTRVTSKGQVDHPQAVRDALGLKPGSRVTFGMEEEGRAFVQPEKAPKEDDFEKRLKKARAKFKLGMTTDEYLNLTRDRGR